MLLLAPNRRLGAGRGALGRLALRRVLGVARKHLLGRKLRLGALLRSEGNGQRLLGVASDLVLVLGDCIWHYLGRTKVFVRLDNVAWATGRFPFRDFSGVDGCAADNSNYVKRVALRGLAGEDRSGMVQGC